MAIVETTRSITGGVETHLDTHVVAALDPNGGVLGVAAFPATRSGYCSLSSWLGEGLPRGPVTSDLWCREVLLEGCASCRGRIPGSSART